MGEFVTNLRQEIADLPLVGVGLAFVIGVSTASVGYSIRDSRKSSSPKAFGTVECPNGQEVVGVWIDAETNKYDGLALITKGLGNVAEYRKTLGKQQGYTVHVGCDSLPDGNWRFKDYARDIAESGRAASFICGPSGDPVVVKAYPDHGTCTLR